MKNKFTQRILSVILAVMMLVSTAAISTTSASAATAATPATAAATGGMPTFLKDALVSVLKSSLVYGLEKAGEATTDDRIAKALDMTISLIDGSEKSMHKDILNEIKHVSEQVDALYSFTAKSFNHIDDQIKDLSETTALNALSTQREKLREFKELKYEPMLQTFNLYINAFVAYGENPTEENKKILKAKYEDVLFYTSDKETMKNFKDDLNSFLMLISPYSPNFDTSNLSNANNCDEWGVKGSYKTYLDYLYDYATEVSNFENNVFDYMSNGINEVGSVGYLYLQSYKFFIQVEALTINNDSNLTPVEAKEKIDKMWSDFELADLKLKRGLNQMYSLYENEMNTFMRTYDTLAKIGINNYKATDKVKSAYNKTKYPNVKFILKTAIVDCSKWNNTTFNSDVIESTQWFYQYKLVNEKGNNAYAIRNSNSTTKNGEKTNKRFAYQDTVEEEIMIGDESCFSLDFINLTKGLTNGLTMVSSQSQLDNIKNSKSYVSSNNLIKNIIRELSYAYGNNVAIPDLSNKDSSTKESNLNDGSFLMLNTDISWNCNAEFPLSSDDADMKWLNISMPLNDNHEIEIDCEDDIVDNLKGDALRDKEAYAMFTGCPKATATLNTSGNGDAYLSVNGNKVATKNTISGTLNSGEVMTLKVKPESGNTVESIILKDNFGNILDTFLDTQFDKDGNITIHAQEMTDTLSKDENGYISFVLPVPCQNVTFEINFTQEDKNLKKNSVTLDGDNNTVMQFTSYDFVTTKYFSQDDTVSFSVMPEDGKVCTGVIITDASGTEMNILVSDITSKTTKFKANEKIFQFTMPDHSVSVKPIITVGNMVNITTDGNATLKSTCVDSIYKLNEDTSSWDQGETFTAKTGDTVVVAPTAKDGFFVSKIDVRTNSGEVVDAFTDGNKIHFVMPDEDIDITVETKVCSDDYVSVTLNIWNDNIYDVEFVDENLTRLNTATTKAAFHDQIMFIVKGDKPRGFSGTDSISSHIYCSPTEISDDSLAEDEHLYVLSVPDIENFQVYVC